VLVIWYIVSFRQENTDRPLSRPVIAALMYFHDRVFESRNKLPEFMGARASRATAGGLALPLNEHANSVCSLRATIFTQFAISTTLWMMLWTMHVASIELAASTTLLRKLITSMLISLPLSEVPSNSLAPSIRYTLLISISLAPLTTVT
jgi:hypothetical protein